MEPARAVAPRILVAVVRNGEMEGGFASVTGVNLAGDVEEFLERVRGWSISLADVELRHMTVYGPWGSAAEVPDMATVTRGRANDVADPFQPLVREKERAYFLVRITTPPVAAGESGVGVARHTWSVPAMSVRFVTSCAPRAFPRTRDSLFTTAIARAFLTSHPCLVF